MKVMEVMHKGVEWVSPETSLIDVARRMKKLDVGSLPVGEHDRLVGMVTDRDIVCRAVANGADLSTLTTRDVMTKGIQYCKDSDDLDKALKKMAQEKVRRLPVINANKRLVGMLAIGDISHATSAKTSGSIMASLSAHH